uniref:(California timema) hypothetical protein n=1 Tax=Timema californicum TaxID=61474 RepID=A0A7R9J8K6_TIMCA|nr:unnamed protein product [Timema californicum]
MAEHTYMRPNDGSPSSRFNGKINGVEGKTPFLIGVAGGTASGKSTVCKRIMEKLGQADMVHAERQVVCISQDSFYRELSPQEKIRAEKGLFNFDHPGQFPSLTWNSTAEDVEIEVRISTKKYADVIIPRGADNTVGIDLIVHHIRDLLHRSGTSKCSVRSSRCSSSCSGTISR